MDASIVLGTAFGDEGKGRTVSYLCENAIKNDLKPLVIRFNGGHQAGHTVVHDGIRHVFSSFGSGTLQGVPTLWSKYCTFYPIGFTNERHALVQMGIIPKIFIDPLCPVTTPYDFVSNRCSDETLKHGTCGVGFGETIKRHETTPYKMYFMDLFNDFIFENKMKNIRDYYYSKINNGHSLINFNLLVEELMKPFYDSISLIKSLHRYINTSKFDYRDYDHLIFEGAQGILLDKDYGLYPNVTYSNTTAKNALSLLDDNDLNLLINSFYVTRTYQTRHGNGPMSNENPDMIPFENETNVKNKYQGKFRLGEFDINLLKYAIQCNEIELGQRTRTHNLVITCNDQYSNTNIYDEDIINGYNIYLSHSPKTNDIVKVLK